MRKTYTIHDIHLGTVHSDPSSKVRATKEHVRMSWLRDNYK